MTKGSSGVLGFLLVLTIFGTYGSRLTTSPQSDVPTKQSGAIGKAAGEPSPPACASEACMMERLEFFISGTETPENSHSATSQPTDSETLFIIATLPDPTRTHLALFFDRLVDAIEQGVQDSGYLFDRAFMPWDVQDHPESSEVLQRLAAEDYQRAREMCPGVMIFRRAPGQRLSAEGTTSGDSETPPKRIVVLVAGEFPTGGIHRRQFENAIKVISRFSKPSRFLMIGPTFSGSLDALPDLVSDAATAFDKQDDIDFHAYAFSGTVSSWKSTVALRATEGAKLTFASFQQNDDYILRAIEDYVRRQGFPVEADTNSTNRSIAVLSEDETAYGSQFSKSSSRFLPLYFPREISQLRSAYQGVKTDQSSTANQPTLTLPLNFERKGGEEDTITTYSGRQLPISQESVLLALVNELRAHKVRFVVLRATDPMDLLFLARYLRSAYPQGRIITLGSDLLFARETQDSRLFGTIAATAYPQVPRLEGNASNANDVQDVDRVFPSSFSSGLYNATRALLQLKKQSPIQTSQNQDSFPPTLSLPSDTKLFHYSWYPLGPMDVPNLGVPPVHLSALGHNGYWPLDVSQPAAPQKGDEKVTAFSTLPCRLPPEQCNPSKTPDKMVHPASPITEEWKVFQVLAFAFSIFLTVCIWNASVLSHENLFSQFSRGKGDLRAGLIATLGFAAVLLVEIALWPDWSHQFSSPWYLFYSGMVLLVAVVAVVGFDIFCRGGRAWLAAFLLGSIGSAAALFSQASPHSYLDERYVFRSLHLISGLSPVLPFILLLASVLWATWHTTAGTALMDERLPKLPYRDSSYPVAAVKKVERRAFAAVASAGGEGYVAMTEIQVSVPGGVGMEKVERRAFAAVASAGGEGYVAMTETQVSVAEAVATASSPSAHRAQDDRATLKAVDMLLADENENLCGLMKPTLFHSRIDGILAMIGIAGLVLVDHDHPLSTLEPHWYCDLIVVLGALCTLTIIGMTWRMWLLWKETKLLLVSLDSRTIRRAFVKIGGISAKPFQIGTNSEGDFNRLVSRAYEAAKCVTNRRIIDDAEIVAALTNLCCEHDKAEAARNRIGFREYWKDYRSSLQQRPRLLEHLSACARLTTKWLNDHFKRDEALIQAFGTFQQAVANAVAKTLIFLVPEWNAARIPVLDEQSTNGARPAGVKQEDVDDPVRVAEHFVCTHYVNFILMVLVRIRAFMTSIVGMYVFVVLAFTVYPFEPSLVLRTHMAVLFLFIVAVAALVYGGMHRDVTLSHITDTTPGELGGDFWLRMISFIVLPLFSLAAAAFPEFNRFLFSWLEPALQALK